VNGTYIVSGGNITAEPELRATPSGKVVLNLRVAVNHRIKVDGEWTNGEPTYYDLVLWEDAAEHAVESLRKGDRVLFTGLMHTQAYEVEGVKRTKQVVTDAEVGASLRFANVSIERFSRAQR
jgi:single-strand DNA-binding protein